MSLRLADYLQHIREAATQACDFVGGQSKEEFLSDVRTQRAVLMNLVIVGEASARVMDQHAAFADEHQDVPWRQMRGMRNRMAHGYFEVNLDLVWDTVKSALPTLLKVLPAAD